MVERDLRARGIDDERVLAAMAEVPRERFVPVDLVEHAHDDRALPIGGGQTISQPYIVALTVEALELGPGDRVLEIGTGSGYAAAVLSRVANRVWTVERLPELAREAARRLAELGYDNVEVVCADGTLGWPPAAPYDAIAVAAAGPRVPTALVEQLAEGGRLVMPLEDGFGQELVRLTRRGDGLEREDLGPVRFVPLVGVDGHRPG